MKIFLICCLFYAVPVFGTEFMCENGKNIPGYFFCDLHTDCPGGSDEIITTAKCANCTSEEISCNNEKNPFNVTCVLHREFICNGTVTCLDVTPCDINCSSHYRCETTSECVPRSTICDGDSCNGCAEDTEWRSGIGFKCIRNGNDCLLPQQLVKDNIKDCDNGEDLCFHANMIFDETRCFKCLSKDIIIPYSKICDGVIDCPDMSDECLCQGEVPEICEHVSMLYSEKKRNQTCPVGSISCGNGKCINRSSVCDGIMDCPDARDEIYAYCKGTLRCVDGDYKLANQTCRCERECHRIYGILCDGNGDCPPPDMNGFTWAEEPGFPDDECTSACYHPNVPQFRCTTPLLDYNFDFTNNLDVIFCQVETNFNDTEIPSMIEHRLITRDHWCDGVIDCPQTMEDESEERCPDRFRCKAGHLMSIDKTKVCDGVPDCDDVSDEVNDTCSDRFYCQVLGDTKISIERKFVCDSNINCDDGSDESNCHDDGRFYCEEGKPMFVTKRHIFDGRGDCFDWSDECPTKSEPLEHNVFSSKYELIGNPIFRALVWIMGGIAIVGNWCVLVGESRTIFRLYKKKDASATLQANHMLVFNLAMADFLMGVYLLMLGITGAYYSGSYCAHKVDWLSSHLCSFMGVLVVISSETSVLTMVMLTSFRLYAVFNPFQSSTKPSPRLVLTFILSTWICSLLVSLLPLSPHLQNVFIDKAVFHNNPFFDNIIVEFDAAKIFVQKLLVYDSKSSNQSISLSDNFFPTNSWSDLENIVSSDISHPAYFKTSQWIGYYSANSVCIPKLFVTLDVSSWSFSFVLTLFNFLSFFFVSIAYVVIYVKSRQSAAIQKTRSLRTKTMSKALQRRIIRLIASDFCCWVPISVMAFINFSGIKVPDIAYVISAVILLPVNSALNPILYSSFMDKYAEKAWRRTSEFGSTLRLSTSTTLSARSNLSTTRL